MGFVDPVRHCGPCSEVTKIEDDFFSNHMKVLFEGAPFHVTTSKSSSAATTPTSPETENSMTESADSISTASSNSTKLFNCKLTSDQRYLVFNEHDSDKEADFGKLDLAKVLGMTMASQDGDADSMVLRTKLNPSEEMTYRLESPPEPSRKPSVLWLSSLQKGLFLVLEDKHDDK